MPLGSYSPDRKGSHRSYSCAGTVRPIVIPTYDEVPVAVIKSNPKTADLSRDEYFRFLESTVLLRKLNYQEHNNSIHIFLTINYF